jgi:DNA-binding MarR family transcriptional regulator
MQGIGRVKKQTESRPASIGEEDYRTLAAFRHMLRQFMAFSETAARQRGLRPQQHQAILAIKAAGEEGFSVGDLAEQLLIRHHSAGELVDRLVTAGLVLRREAADDRRRVRLTLTGKSEEVLEALSATHISELRRTKPMLEQLLQRLDGD